MKYKISARYFAWIEISVTIWTVKCYNANDYRVGKETGVAENLEWHGDNKSADEEKTRKHEHVGCVHWSVTATTKQHTLQLLAVISAQCSPVHLRTIRSCAVCNHIRFDTYFVISIRWWLDFYRLRKTLTLWVRLWISRRYCDIYKTHEYGLPLHIWTLSHNRRKFDNSVLMI